MKRTRILQFWFGLILVCTSSWPAKGLSDAADYPIANADAVPDVVASIKPIHSLVAAVMQGVGEPELLISGNASPHTFSLKPSSASLLQDADLVFWVGPALEQFLVRPLVSLAAQAERVALGELLQGDGAHDSVVVEEHARHGESHQHAADAHVWLDPDRAIQMLNIITDRLVMLDPIHAATYRDNARQTSDQFLKLSREIEQRLGPWLDVPYIVFHDAYGAFEERFSITHAMPFLLNPESSSGANRIQRMRAAIRDQGVVCLFVEPQFPVAIVDVLSEGSAVRRGVLDPLGGELEPGPDLYPELLLTLTEELVRCLAEH